MRPLLEATARLLYRLPAIAFPLAFAKGDVYDFVTRVRKFFQEGTDEALHCTIKTSAGFHQRFCCPIPASAGNHTGFLSTTTRPARPPRL